MKARHTFQTLFRLVLVSLLVVSGTASAEDAKGMLKVSTDKGEATVYLGLEEVGQAPMQQYMDTGTYTIRVLKDGFEPYVRKIHIRPNQATSVTAKLFPGKGSVEFLVEPSGAELTLNKSKETFNTPVRLAGLEAFPRIPVPPCPFKNTFQTNENSTHRSGSLAWSLSLESPWLP